MSAARRAAPLPRKTAAQKARAAEIFDALQARHPDAKCELDYRTPHELLVATILSAQSTDVGVNKATPALFKAFPTPQALADAGATRIEPYVSSLNFFRNKARAIAESMRTIVEQHGGEVPRTMDALLALRGVARKTANVVLGNAFDLPEGVVVDTHVGRLSKRFGLTRHDDPAKVERDLMALFPRERWTLLSHLLIFHGRRACKARGGTCGEDELCRRFCSNARRAPAKSATSRPPRRSPRTR
ncbi:MAG: endonuclease III [Phycisphaerales bacterium]